MIREKPYFSCKMEEILKMDLTRYIKHLPNLHISGSAFFDPDMTYFTLSQDILMLGSTVCYNWCLDCAPQGLAPRTQGISEWTLFLYALAYTVRLVELNPFEHLYYDVAVCLGFAFVFWISLAKSIYYNSKVPLIMDSAERKGALFRSRPIFIHATVMLTALLAYGFNYDHLKITGKLFCFAWSHYLEAVAMIPQYMVLATLMKNGSLMLAAKEIWIIIGLVTFSRLFQLANWSYLWHVSQLMDKLAVISAYSHIFISFLFLFGMVVAKVLQKMIQSVERELEVKVDPDGKKEAAFRKYCEAEEEALLRKKEEAQKQSKI